MHQHTSSFARTANRTANAPLFLQKVDKQEELRTKITRKVRQQQGQENVGKAEGVKSNDMVGMSNGLPVDWGTLLNVTLPASGLSPVPSPPPLNRAVTSSQDAKGTATAPSLDFTTLQ